MYYSIIINLTDKINEKKSLVIKESKSNQSFAKRVVINLDYAFLSGKELEQTDIVSIMKIVHSICSNVELFYIFMFVDDIHQSALLNELKDFDLYRKKITIISRTQLQSI